MSIDNNGDSPTPFGGSAAAAIVPPETRQQAADDFASVKETAQHDLDSISRQAAADVSELKHQAQDQIGAAADKAKSFAADQKDLAADQLGGIAAAVSKVAEELSNGDQATVGRYAKDLAGGLEKFANTVRDKDTDDLMGMAQDFGRSQPLAFLGAAALAGFVASRFALASSHRRSTKTEGTADFGGDQSNNYRPSTSPAYGGSNGGGNV